MRPDGRIPVDRIAVPGAAVGDTLVWDGVRFRPSAPSGGGLLGYAEVVLSFPSTVAQDATVTGGTLSLFGEFGTHGASVSGDELTLWDDSVPSLYLLTATVHAEATTGTSTDLHSAYYSDGSLIDAAHVFLGPSSSGVISRLQWSAQYRSDSPLMLTPSLLFQSSGSSQSYDVNLAYLVLSRWAA